MDFADACISTWPWAPAPIALRRAWRWLLLNVALLALLSGCASLPSDPQQTPSTAFEDWRSTSLGQTVAEVAGRHPGWSGFSVLDTGQEFFAEVAALSDAAEQAIDAQYFVWQRDTAGRLLAARLLEAAERGVRVRLLLDDYPIRSKDGPLAALNAHPNFEVRIYNPALTGFRRNVGKSLKYLLEFDRLNQRMHNKAFIVDGSVAVVGGRNIGDEYVAIGKRFNFRDRDLLAVGPIVAQVAKSFDAYWNSAWAYPVESMFQSPSPQQVATTYARLREFASAEATALPYPLPSGRTQAWAHLERMPARLIWADAKLVYDVPHTEASATAEAGAVATALRRYARQAEQEILVESPYLVPTNEAQQLSADAVSRGVRLRMLTNSLAATDVTVAHAGYSRRRHKLLEQGVELFELRADAVSCARYVEMPEGCVPPRHFSLHAKSVVIDRRTLYVGSFNVSPRSTYLNSEMAIIVESPELAETVAREIESSMHPENSWQVTLGGDGSLEWTAVDGERVRFETREPDAGFLRGIKAGFFALFPLENQI